MTEILTSAQMRAIEMRAMESGSVTGEVLMERAGQGVVDAILTRWPEMARAPALAAVLCGPGNNGGDGFVIARLLRDRGWQVECFFSGDVDRLPPDARLNHDRCGAVRPLADFKSSLREWGDHNHPALWIDALFGTGLTRPLEGEALEALRDASVWSADLVSERVGDWVAVDIPSGVNADTGSLMGLRSDDLPRCDLTVTFHRSKLGHYLEDGPRHCGALAVVDIGLTEPCIGAVRKTSFDRRYLKSAGHKYDYGHALIIGGPVGRSGAARMAARAALRAGAGLVTIAVPRDALAEYAAHTTAVMLAVVDTPDDLAQLLQDKRYDRICIGPACGIDRAADFLPVVLAAQRLTVIDADALTALAQSTRLHSLVHAKCTLTPHDGEFARLFPDMVAMPKVEAVVAAAGRMGCTVLRKGPATVVANAFGVRLNDGVYDMPAPWLATAGSGDVLAGLITALGDACAAAWLHTMAARSFGPGLIAEDLSEEIPKVYRQLGL